MDLARFEKLDIVLISGLPGSGKSHFARTFFKDSGRKRVNRKEIARLLFEMTNFGEPWSEINFEKADEYLVKHIERAIILQLIHDGAKLIIDNTSVTVESRKAYVDLARQTKKRIGVIFLRVPPVTCIQRNRASTDPVPDVVIANLAASIALPSDKEGFAEIAVADA
ncbi:MAG: ATP-binding protein [Spirochaetes bacterium]|nr:ATP-binding protein [Spirochaetota bacterium]